MSRDEQMQEALDRRHRAAASTVADGTPDDAAYRVVFAALHDDDGFDLPADFADALVARLLPEPVGASPFERYVLPLLLAVAFAVAIPSLAAGLGPALTGLARAVPDTAGVQILAVITLTVIVVAAADRLFRRMGHPPV